MSFIKKSIISVFGTILLGLANFGIAIFLSRWLSSVAVVGQYQIIISAVITITAVLSLGVGQANIYYTNNQNIDISVITSLGKKFAFVMSLVLLAFFPFILRYESYFGQMSSWAIWSVCLFGVSLIYGCILHPILIAHMQVIRYKVIQLLPRIVLLCLIVLIFAWRRLTLDTVLFATALGQFLAMLLVLWFLREVPKIKASLKDGLLRSLIYYGLKLNLSYVILTMESRAGVLIIPMLLPGNFSEAGYYSRAVAIGALLPLLGSAVGTLLYSKWSGTDASERHLQFESVSRVFFSFGVLCTILLIPFSFYLIKLCFGEAFIPAVPMLKVLLPGVCARFIIMPHLYMFSSIGKPLFMSLILGIILGIMIILMILLVPIYSGVGAALAFTISNLIGLLVAYFISWRNLEIRIHKCQLVTIADLQYLRKSLTGLRVTVPWI